MKKTNLLFVLCLPLLFSCSFNLETSEEEYHGEVVDKEVAKETLKRCNENYENVSFENSPYFTITLNNTYKYKYGGISILNSTQKYAREEKYASISSYNSTQNVLIDNEYVTDSWSSYTTFYIEGENTVLKYDDVVVTHEESYFYDNLESYFTLMESLTTMLETLTLAIETQLEVNGGNYQVELGDYKVFVSTKSKGEGHLYYHSEMNGIIQNIEIENYELKSLSQYFDYSLLDDFASEEEKELVGDLEYMQSYMTFSTSSFEVNK